MLQISDSSIEALETRLAESTEKSVFISMARRKHWYDGKANQSEKEWHLSLVGDNPPILHMTFKTWPELVQWAENLIAPSLEEEALMEVA